MSDFDYLRQDAALSRLPLDPPEGDHHEDCRAWKHRHQCNCPQLAEADRYDHADRDNKARREG